jgi:hypothetical protein
MTGMANLRVEGSTQARSESLIRHSATRLATPTLLGVLVSKILGNDYSSKKAGEKTRKFTTFCYLIVIVMYN